MTPPLLRFRHYKGGIYVLICEATLEADHTPMMVCRGADGRIWCRPKTVFFEEVDSGGRRVPRFVPIED